MKLSNHGDYRPKDEKRCLFAIIGNSSKLDQHEGDFDNDFDHGKEYQYEEKEVRKMIERPASIDDYKSLLQGEEATSESSQYLQRDPGSQKTEFLNIPKSRIRTISDSTNVRYEKEWK